MKANVPKKLYLIQRNGLISYCRNNEDDAEYILTDAFIEMAVERLKHYLDNSVWVANDVGVREKEVIIEDFKNYMKG